MNIFFYQIRKFFVAPVFDGDQEQTQSAKLLYQIIAVIWVLPVLLVVMGTLGGRAEVFFPAVVISLSLLFLMAITQIGWVGFANAFITAMIFLVFCFADYQNAGNIQPSTLITAVAIIMSGLLLGRRAPLVMSASIALSHAFIVNLQIQGKIQVSSAPAVGSENMVITGVMVLVIGFLFQFVISRLVVALEQARKNEKGLQEISASLEQRVAERTKALATSAEVSRRLTAILDPRELAGAVVNQVQTAFNYYYAQVYLFDETGENLVLTAGTGDAGAAMIKRGHSLPKGRGLVGRAADTKESILVSDTSQDPNWLPNDLLPDTKAEAAIPITIGDQVLGVLDVQNNVTNGLSQQDADLLQSVGNQVAIALQNARQYTGTQTLLRELGEAQSFLNSVVENLPTMLFVKNAEDLRFVRWNKAAEELSGFPRESLIGKNDYDFFPKEEADFFTSKDRQTLANGQLLDIPEEPLATAHQGMRYLHTRKVPIYGADGNVKYLLGISEDITERKRLQELTALRARQQEDINVITQKIQAATTIEDAMQIAARELGHALGKRQTMVELEPSALGSKGKEN